MEMTGLTKDNIAKSFRSLVKKNIIELENPNQRIGSRLRVNPNFKDWSGYSPAQSIIKGKGRMEKMSGSENLHEAV